VWRRQLRAIALLPGMVTVVVPALLVWSYGADLGWDLPAPLSVMLVLAGIAVIAVGLRLWVETIRLFVEVGGGTLAPWDPTRKLVVRGPYRRVRNPMISALGFVLLGEAAVLGSPPVLILFGGFVVANATYIPLFEEPGLLRRFGDEYAEYRRAVPRWIPRRTPWIPTQ
jgi:protein-S-isoprenylcysteine O-methyltransferase Ste14